MVGVVVSLDMFHNSVTFTLTFTIVGFGDCVVTMFVLIVESYFQGTACL